MFVVVDGEAVLLIGPLVVEAWRVLDDTPILTTALWAWLLAGHSHMLVSGRGGDDVGPAVFWLAGKGSVVPLVVVAAAAPQAELLPPGTACGGGRGRRRGRARTAVERHGKYLHFDCAREETTSILGETSFMV